MGPVSMIATRNILRLGSGGVIHSSCRTATVAGSRQERKSRRRFAGCLSVRTSATFVSPQFIASASKTLQNKTQPSGAEDKQKMSTMLDYCISNSPCDRHCQSWQQRRIYPGQPDNPERGKLPIDAATPWPNRY
jgi:hypothetical protein